MRRPGEAILRNRIHDTWVGIAASVIGKVLYDPCPGMLYRQHDNNVIGVKKASILSEWIKKIRRKEKRRGRSLASREVYEKFGDLIHDPAVKQDLYCYGFYLEDRKMKKKLLKDRELGSHTGESVWMFRLKVLCSVF